MQGSSFVSHRAWCILYKDIKIKWASVCRRPKILAHGRYLTDIDSLPLPLNSPPGNPRSACIEFKPDYCTPLHCSVLRKLQRKAMLRAATCHSSTLSSGISPVGGESVSRKWGVSWVPALKSIAGPVRAETNTEFPGQPITGSSRDCHRLLTAAFAYSGQARG